MYRVHKKCGQAVQWRLTNGHKACNLKVMKMQCYAQTNIGSVRKDNEDNYYCNGSFKLSARSPQEELISAPEGSEFLFGVFDGMGGEARGEECAMICAATLSQFQEREQPFEAPAFYQQANEAVCSLEQRTNETGGSTAAVAQVRGNRVFASNAGDSRVYHLRGKTLKCLTRDHTRYQQMIEAGVPNPDPSERHVLTKFIGMDNRRPLTPNFAVSVKLEVGDRILLCSDGITGVLSDEVITETLSRTRLPEVVGRALVQQALEAGSRDNVTVVLAEVVALDDETLPEEVPTPSAVTGGDTTKEFGAVTPAQIMEREQEMRREQKRETRREMRMIIAVILAVLAISGAIIYLALRRSIHNDAAPSTPASVCVIAADASALPQTTAKENAYVRS